MKKCFKCQKLKPLSDFYAHPKMKDGHLNKCKSCTKKETANREARLMANPVTREQELARHREKSRRYREDGRAKPVSKTAKRQTIQKHRQKHPKANRARASVAYALRTGKLTRLPCVVCGEKAQAHHADYSKPIEVEWLCAQHHAEADLKRRIQQRNP